MNFHFLRLITEGCFLFPIFSYAHEKVRNAEQQYCEFGLCEKIAFKR